MITIDSKISKVFEELNISYKLEENHLDVSFFSPQGQDFNASFQAENFETLLKSMTTWIENFDADEEAYIWIGDDGHGKNGAPYHIKDIVNDMEWCHEQIDTLHDMLIAIDQEREYTYEMCPHCVAEIEVVAELAIQQCPSCGKHIVICSMCESCHTDCPLEAKAHKMNEGQK